ncbi:MAG TPA: hypothetical protein VIY51_27265 [Xanthobacteraceae bacterium]
MPLKIPTRSAFDQARRWAALGLLRLASLVLRKSLDLYQTRNISRVDLRIALSAARLLERSGGVLLLGLKRHSD